MQLSGRAFIVLLHCAAQLASSRFLSPPKNSTVTAQNRTMKSECYFFTDNNVADWSTKCLEVTSDTEYIRIDIGSVTDYFKPAGSYGWCEMFTSNNKHVFSYDGETWVTPTYYPYHYGGSGAYWPIYNGREGDNRIFLTVWASNPAAHYMGCGSACCSNSYESGGPWGQTYNMYTCGAIASASGSSDSGRCPNSEPSPLTLGDAHPSNSGSSASGSSASATGDPHLQNVHGERFDLMTPGRHVLVNIPRGERAENALLRVEARASKLGGLCEDIYFTDLNITGSWAYAKQVGGYHFASEGSEPETSTWNAVGAIEFKVVRAHTAAGTQYLNFYVKHLGRAGFVVGGLLGEDDHVVESTPSAACVKHLQLKKLSSPLYSRDSAVSIAQGTFA